MQYIVITKIKTKQFDFYNLNLKNIEIIKTITYNYY